MEDLWGDESDDFLLNEVAERAERNEIENDGDDLMLSQNLEQTERSQQKCEKEQRVESNHNYSNSYQHSKPNQGSVGQLDVRMSSIEAAATQNTHEVPKSSTLNTSHESNSQPAQANQAAGPSQETEAELQKQKKSLEQVKNTFDNELQCSICNELFVQATSLNCAHAFCALCINQWLRTSQACPMCRTTVTSQTRSLVLDNFIEKMCEHFGDDMKEDRRALVESRKLEQAQYDSATRMAPPLPRSPSPPIIVEVLDRSPSSLSSTSDLPLVRDRSPLSPFYVSSDYSGSFIHDSDMSVSTFSDSGDSLNSTDSSATDFSDHSPRSRQRRRETRHRHRNEDSDSSMSHGRRIDWRRRQRTRERRTRSGRMRNSVWNADDETENSSALSEVEDSPERSRISRGRMWEEDSGDSMFEERGTRHRRRRLESSDSDVEGSPVRRSRRQRRRPESSDSNDDSPSREAYRSGRLESSEESPAVLHRRRRGRRLESDSEDSEQERDRRREGTRERERDREERQRDREEMRRDREERRRDREERRRDREIRRRERRDRHQGRRRHSIRDRRRDQEGEMSLDENCVRDNRRPSGHGRERSRSDRRDPEMRSDDTSSARTGSRRTSHRNTHRNINYDERPTTSTTSYTPASRVYYGGYGKCFRCGRSGHWANGCPTR